MPLSIEGQPTSQRRSRWPLWVAAAVALTLVALPVIALLRRIEVPAGNGRFHFRIHYTPGYESHSSTFEDNGDTVHWDREESYGSFTVFCGWAECGSAIFDPVDRRSSFMGRQVMAAGNETDTRHAGKVRLDQDLHRRDARWAVVAVIVIVCFLAPVAVSVVRPFELTLGRHQVAFGGTVLPELATGLAPNPGFNHVSLDGSQWWSVRIGSLLYFVRWTPDTNHVAT